MLKHKRYLFQLNHPAHYHFYKNTIDILRANGHDVLISIKDKDILKDLVKELDVVQISTGYRKKSFSSIFKSLIERDKKLYKIAKEFKPDLMIGTSPEIGQISSFVKAPSIFFGEDDVNLSFVMFLGALTCYPFFKSILAPTSVNNLIWNRKTTFYEGFQKLAYLHPNRFTPDRSKVDLPIDHKYFILRFANLMAYHDVNAKGITNSLAEFIVEILSKKGTVFISSERELPDSLKKFQFVGNINDMHHYISFASLLIGDSQSMAVESAMLGTPNIRYNNFVGKISVLEQLEHKYELTYGIKSNEPEKLIKKIEELLAHEDLNSIFQTRRQRMLKEKIDLTAFMVWFIENYPVSARIMKENPDYQYNFK